MPENKRRKEDHIISKCLFPAAGYGTRFLPATKATPKEMLPILTKPLIQYGVEEAVEAGIHTMAIIGRYILTPDIFDILGNTKPGKGGEIQITDALLEQAKQGKVIAYKFKGKRFDCGSVDGFVEATNYFYKRERE